MRVAENNVLVLGQVDIDGIELDPKSRDDIPAVLLGIQAIHRDADLRGKVLDLLSSHLLQDSAAAGGRGQAAEDDKRINPDAGRPGMSLWCMLVLALLKQGLNCDYDRLHELACKHLDVRHMLGMSDVFCASGFSCRTVVRNVSLLTPALLEEINQEVVRAGHRLSGREKGGC